MDSIIDILEQRIASAMAKTTDQQDCPAIVKAAADPKFGDYQANGVMALAKKLKTNPRQLAQDILKNLDISDICENVEIAGPGFINLWLSENFIKNRLFDIKNDKTSKIGLKKAANPLTIVVDFSCPNVAKQMHVGHLRSTIIGDCICRILELDGHNVIRQNHIGDWGTQFGMLIAYLKRENPNIETHIDDIHITDLEQFYKNSKKVFDQDSDFANTSRSEVVKLQSGDQTSIKIWKKIVDESRSHYQPIYNDLMVTLKTQHERGESFYNDMLPAVVEDLKTKGLAEESDGAICVFLEGFSNKEGQPLPFIIQKSDGAFLYATTDLAAIRYRVTELNADKIIYVTDARQKLHFEQLFATVKKAGWDTNKNGSTELNHVTFGTVLGEDNKPLKTRSGENIKLKDLLDEAVQRAMNVVQEKNPDLDETSKQEIAKAVGIGAVKYADYSNNRTSDYMFSFDKMLAMDGNTAPYMQYAYARVKSIERKAGEKGVDINTELANIADLNLTKPAEIDLAKHIIRYNEAIKAALADYRPNYLTTYLYELSQKFSSFYTNCPVLIAEPEKRPTRLLLCDLTAKTIKHGMTQLLGIEVVEQM